MTILGRLERDLLILRLASEAGDVDEELRRALERMRTFFSQAWAALDELYLSSRGVDPSKLKLWREAPEHSPEGLKARDHERAIGMLAFWLGLPSGVSPED